MPVLGNFSIISSITPGNSPFYPPVFFFQGEGGQVGRREKTKVIYMAYGHSGIFTEIKRGLNGVHLS